MNELPETESKAYIELRLLANLKSDSACYYAAKVDVSVIYL